MRWVLITPFGMPVEPEVNRNFAIVSGPTLACAASTAAVGVVAARVRRTVSTGRSATGLRVTTSSISGGIDRLDRACERLAVAANTRPGVSRLDDVTQLAEIAGDQRVGRRDRRVGDAGIHRGEGRACACSRSLPDRITIGRSASRLRCSSASPMLRAYCSACA